LHDRVIERGNSAAGGIVMLFAQTIDPSTIAEAAKGGPVTLLALILAALVGYLFWKEKANREDSKEQRQTHVASVEKIVDKVTVAMDKNTVVLGELGNRVGRVEERVGGVEDTIKHVTMKPIM
jgi:hypothetical protein